MVWTWLLWSEERCGEYRVEEKATSTLDGGRAGNENVQHEAKSDRNNKAGLKHWMERAIDILRTPATEGTEKPTPEKSESKELLPPA